MKIINNLNIQVIEKRLYINHKLIEGIIIWKVAKIMKKLLTKIITIIILKKQDNRTIEELKTWY